MVWLPRLRGRYALCVATRQRCESVKAVKGPRESRTVRAVAKLRVEWTTMRVTGVRDIIGTSAEWRAARPSECLQRLSLHPSKLDNSTEAWP
jgi:hypothetical protein